MPNCPCAIHAAHRSCVATLSAERCGIASTGCAMAATPGRERTTGAARARWRVLPPSIAASRGRPAARATLPRSRLHELHAAVLLSPRLVVVARHRLRGAEALRLQPRRVDAE